MGSRARVLGWSLSLFFLLPQEALFLICTYPKTLNHLAASPKPSPTVNHSQGYCGLYGIESPGLTSSLMIADQVLRVLGVPIPAEDF